MPKRPDLREFVLVKRTMEQVNMDSATNGISSSPPPQAKKPKVKDSSCEPGIRYSQQEKWI